MSTEHTIYIECDKSILLTIDVHPTSLESSSNYIPYGLVLGVIYGSHLTGCIRGRGEAGSSHRYQLPKMLSAALSGGNPFCNGEAHAAEGASSPRRQLTGASPPPGVRNPARWLPCAPLRHLPDRCGPSAPEEEPLLTRTWLSSGRRLGTSLPFSAHGARGHTPADPHVTTGWRPTRPDDPRGTTPASTPFSARGAFAERSL